MDFETQFFYQRGQLLDLLERLPMAFPTEERFVARAEEKLGFRLPSSHRQRLIESNGGDLDLGRETWSLYPVCDDSDRKRLKRTAYDLVKETQAARKWTHFPPQAAALGQNGGGDYLIVYPGDDQIYRWDHETGSTVSL